MPRLDELPPDLRATLSLLVDRGKSYAEVADMLAIPQSAVRDRAHAALDALAADPTQPSAPGTTASSRPADPPGRTSDHSPPPASAASARRPATLPSSRRGGALLLAAIVAVIVVAVILLSGGGSSKGKTSSSPGGAATSSTGSSTGTTSTKASKKPTEDKRIVLTSPEQGSKAVGAAEVLSEGSKYAILILAKHLPPTTNGAFYAVWLANSSTSFEPVGEAPAVDASGSLRGGALLPSNAAEYDEILLTRETSKQPTQPGPIVLSGPFALH
jgi:hypothetical protein